MPPEASAVRSTDFSPNTATTSAILRSLIGIHLRNLGGWIAVADLGQLMAQAGSTPTGTRSALVRAKAKKILEPQKVSGRAGYRLCAGAEAMLARGDRRIYGYRQMTDDDPWMLVIFSIPEGMRHLRHQLRSELIWLGCGMLAPGTWIGPGHLLDETRDVLAEHGLLQHVTLVLAQTPHTVKPLSEAVLDWWDFDELSQRYEQFISEHRTLASSWRNQPGTDEQAFVDHLKMIDSWRSIPCLDPALPAALLPETYRGAEGVALFSELQNLLAPAAERHVRAVTGTST